MVKALGCILITEDEAAEICDDYCKYPLDPEYKGDKLIDEICANCPLVSKSEVEE